MSSEKGATDGGNAYQIRKPVVWTAGVLGLICLVLAIALPLSLTKENEIRRTTYANSIRPHDPFKQDIFTKWKVSKEARDAFNSLSRRQVYGQCTQFDWQRNQDGGFDPSNYRDYIRQGLVGSLLNLQERTETDAVQEMATEFGFVPILFANDTIHGQATIFPLNIAMAAAFSPELIEKGTRIAAIETRNSGVRMTFGPNLDIGRDPRWGRVSEGSGEDPYLTGVLGAAYVRAFQEEGVAACIKHVSAYGIPESGRDYQPANLDLSELLNVFLQAMKPAILESWTFMPSYSAMDGMAAHGYRFMINDIIRGHWGWDGVVMADYTAVEDLQNLWVAEDAKDSARKGIYGGVDLSMSDGVYLSHLDSVSGEIAPDGHTYQEYAELSAKRIIALKDKLGMFGDQLYEPGWDNSLFCHNDHMAVARETVRKSIVMVHNKDNTLPMADTTATNVLLVGSLADEPRHMIGSWPGRAFMVDDCYPSKVITYRRAFCVEADRENAQFGCDYTPGYTHPFYPNIYDNEANGDVAARNYQETLTKATSGTHSHILFFVGDLEVMNGESTSRTNLTLTGTQLNLMQDVHAEVQKMPAANRPKLIAIFLTGRANIMEWELEHLDAVVYGWVSGHQGGPGLRDVLFGHYDATGRLPFTQPKNIGQIPIFYYQANSTRDIFRNGVDCTRWVQDPANPDGDWIEEEYLCDEPYVGNVQYVSKYIDSTSDPRFVFAHGLHYNDYTLSDVEVSPATVGMNGRIKITGNLNKSGNYDSAEIVQVYVRDDVRTWAPPNKLLRRFERIEFDASPATATKSFEFELDVQEDFGFYTPELNYIVEKGTFTIWVGFNSADERLPFTVTVA